MDRATDILPQQNFGIDLNRAPRREFLLPRLREALLVVAGDGRKYQQQTAGEMAWKGKKVELSKGCELSWDYVIATGKSSLLMVDLHFKHFKHTSQPDAVNCHFQNDSSGSPGRTDAGNVQNVSASAAAKPYRRRRARTAGPACQYASP